MSAGNELRAAMARELEYAAVDAGRPLEYDEREAQIIASAAATADRAEELRALLHAEMACDTRASVVVKIAAEIRLCEKHLADLLARINPGPGTAKSERHVRAARSRWDRDPVQARRDPARARRNPA